MPARTHKRRSRRRGSPGGPATNPRQPNGRQAVKAASSSVRLWTLIAMALGSSLTALYGTIVTVALPAIQHQFEASLDSLAWIINAYTLALAATLVCAGRLGDIYGRRRLFLAGSAAFAAASLACGLAPSIGWLLFFRAVQGVCESIMLPVQLGILTDVFPAEKRGWAIAVWAGAIGVGSALGPVAGGFLTATVGWQWIFFVAAPWAAAGAVIAVAVIPESHDESARGRPVDWLGMVLVGAALTALIYGIIEGDTAGWTSPVTLASVTAALVLGGLFAVVEQRVTYPLVEFHLFRAPVFLAANGVTAIQNFGFYGILFFLALYLQRVLGASPPHAGLLLVPATAAAAVASAFSGRLAVRGGRVVLVLLPTLTMVTALALLARLGPASSDLTLLAPFLIAGAGYGLSTTTASAAAVAAVPADKSAAASGVLLMSRMVGQTVGLAVMETIFEISKRTALDALAGGSASLSAPERSAVALHLAGGPAAAKALAAVGESGAARVVAAAHDVFVAALSNTMGITAAVLLVASLATAALMRGHPLWQASER